MQGEGVSTSLLGELQNLSVLGDKMGKGVNREWWHLLSATHCSGQGPAWGSEARKTQNPQVYSTVWQLRRGLGDGLSTEETGGEGRVCPLGVIKQLRRTSAGTPAGRVHLQEGRP